MYRGGFIGRFLYKLAYPFRTLSSSKATFLNASPRGRAAIIFATGFLGGGRFFTGEILKGFLLLLTETLGIVYFIFFGFAFITRAKVYPGLEMQFVNILLLVLLVYLYFWELAKVLGIVQKKAYKSFNFLGKIQTQKVNVSKKAEAFKALWKKSSKAERFDLLSPYYLLGYYQIKQGAYFKGICLFLLEVGFIVYLAMTGAYDLYDFIRLDTDFRPSTFNLVYGFVAIAVILVFIFLYLNNIKNVRKSISQKTNIKKFKEELKSLKDEKLYVSFLSFPVLGVVLFTVVPLIFMISIAFTGYQGASQSFRWTGFSSFQNLFLISDNLYTLLSVTRWTLIWAFFATFTNYFGGIFLALLINKKGLKGKKVWRTVFIITMAVPQFVSLLIMNQMFAYDGPVNQFLLNIGLINQNINFWGVQWRARVLIIIINMWVGIPYLMLLTSGILMNIPSELYEAAVIEGANKRQLFTKVTMPYMLFVTTPLLVSGFVGNINNFNVIYLLTAGKPLGMGLVNAGGTDILITWLYQLTKTHQLYNFSAAVGILIFILSAFISLTIYQRTAAYKDEGGYA
ncbi:MAG: sugar ABC transporter permease [Bacilli bacterium]|nr:sugar ABC transporter permease [Bacilli bacterium]